MKLCARQNNFWILIHIPYIKFLECGQGEWGVDCRDCCHCASGGKCNPITGECNSGICSECWAGSNCQESKQFYKIFPIFCLQRKNNVQMGTLWFVPITLYHLRIMTDVGSQFKDVNVWQDLLEMDIRSAKVLAKKSTV